MRLLRVLATIAVTLQVTSGYAQSPGMKSQGDSASGASPEVAALCSEGGTLDMNQAHRLRDYLGSATTRKDQLLAIGDALSDALRRCSAGFSIVDAEIVGGLRVVLGNRLILEKEYSRAKQAFETADQVFTRFGVPSLMWLAALQGEARAELMLGNILRADAIASNQANMAREWVDKQHFASGALVDALRFQAKIRTAEDQRESATQLLNEADRLESRE